MEKTWIMETFSDDVICYLENPGYLETCVKKVPFLGKTLNFMFLILKK